MQRTRRMRAAARPITMVEGDDQVTHVGERTWRIGVNGFGRQYRAAPAAYARTVVEMVAGDMRDAVAWTCTAVPESTPAHCSMNRPRRCTWSIPDAGAIGAACATFAEDPRLVVYQGRRRRDGGRPAETGDRRARSTTNGEPAARHRHGAAGPHTVVYIASATSAASPATRLPTAHGYHLRSLRASDAFPAPTTSRPSPA